MMHGPIHIKCVVIVVFVVVVVVDIVVFVVVVVVVVVVKFKPSIFGLTAVHSVRVKRRNSVGWAGG